MKKQMYGALALSFLLFTNFNYQEKKHNVNHSVKKRIVNHNIEKHDDYVPDEATAIKVAVAILEPIFGGTVDYQRPYNAKLYGNVWYVYGSLHPGELGGVVNIEIRKYDCKIVRVSSGK
ncbi:hypothetical protein BH09BAC6_BH09BAC6_18020 [soil metagenome]|jgi:hypothetical protein